MRYTEQDKNIDLPHNIRDILDLPKDQLYLSLHKALQENIVPVLYDRNIISITKQVQALHIDMLPKNTAAIFFTSGTTGEPTGVLKSRENLFSELATFKTLFHTYQFEQIIVTVPLIHIYGFLCGLLLPSILKTDVILKEEFLPHELLELAGEKKTLCVTSPVFLNVLTKLHTDKIYPNITFLSSTGKLDPKTVTYLNTTLQTSVYQLFGSTETGGIAYKKNDMPLWKPLPSVHIDETQTLLSVSSPFISEYTLDNGHIRPLHQPFTTTDIIALHPKGFSLLGRKSEIIKIAGKRISILEIESLLESLEDIHEALVQLVYDNDSHKNEYLSISVISNAPEETLKNAIKDLLQYHYKHIHFKTTLTKVDSIPKNHLGKKLRR